MNCVDAHFHLWDLKENYYPWLTDKVNPNHVAGDYTAIRKNYLLNDYLLDIAGTSIAKGVHIQAEHDPSDPVRETRWLQSVADGPGSRGFPHAIVAHVLLENPDVERILDEHCAYANVRGVRQVMPADAVSSGNFAKGLSSLRRRGLSFDLRIRHPEMHAAAELARANPGVQFILTHMGYPVSQDPEYRAAWRQGLKTMAARENVVVKLSGFGFIDPTWTLASMRPLVREVIDQFGPSRCMFASDFPVDSLSRDLRSFWTAFETLASEYSAEERLNLLGANAERVYRI